MCRTVANSVVLALCFAPNTWRKQIVNLPLINQVSLDLFSCFWLMVSISVKLRGYY